MKQQPWKRALSLMLAFALMFAMPCVTGVYAAGEPVDYIERWWDSRKQVVDSRADSVTVYTEIDPNTMTWNGGTTGGWYVVSDAPSGEEAILKKLEARNVEGAIVLGYEPEKCEELTMRAPKPIVFVDSGDGNYDNVGLQDREGAAQMTEYLIRQGHQRIAFFTDYQENSVCNRMRMEGYREALRVRKLPFLQEDIYSLPLDRHMRNEIIRKFAREKAGRVCTAAFFVNDLFANEAVGMLSAEGIRVPEDLSVAGFDDNIYARLSNPMLTTVRQHPEEKAYEAVKMLMKRLRGEPVPVRSIHLPTELIVRDSVKNLVSVR